MWKRTRDSRTSGGSPVDLKMDFSLVALLILSSWCISSTSTKEVDNDLIFDDGYESIKNKPKPNLSSQDSKQISVPHNIDVINQDPAYVDDDIKDIFFERLNHHLNRIKRKIDGFNIFDWFGSRSTSSSTDSTSYSTSDYATDARTKRNTDEMASTFGLDRKRSTENEIPRGDNPKKSDDEKEDDNENDDEEEGANPEEEEYDVQTPARNGVSSGDSSTSVTTSPVPASTEKNYFRLNITLLVPFESNMAVKSGNRFKELANDISTGIKQVLSAPDFIQPNVIAITMTRDTSRSKAIVDLTSIGSESEENVRSLLTKHLMSRAELNHVPASEDHLVVTSYDDKAPRTCEEDELPCVLTDACYKIDNRCNGHSFCKDRSDEFDCPNKDDADVPEIDNTCTRNDEQFWCSEGGRYICFADICNDQKDCIFGEDEINCTVYFRLNVTLLVPYENDMAEKSESRFKELAGNINSGVTEILQGKDFKRSNIVAIMNTANTNRSKVIVDLSFKESGNQGNISNSLNNLVEHLRTREILNGVHASSKDLIITDHKFTAPQPCQNDEFPCSKGDACYKISERCNGYYSCEDHSDEFDCPVCQQNEYKCDNKCFHNSTVCDGKRDCSDGRDELDCPKLPVATSRNRILLPSDEIRPEKIIETRNCTEDEFQCKIIKECIPKSKVCDSNYDCEDKSDENKCPCRENEFQCDNGLCISQTRVCDNITNCSDFSDEKNCTKNETCNSANEFRCDNGDCIPSAQKCDKKNDCKDASDEKNCTYACRRDQITCYDGACIEGDQRCDGKPDCSQGEDEVECPRGCSEAQFKCRNNECIALEKRCDGVFDCADSSDEDCPTSAPPSPPEPVPCRSDEFTCRTDHHCVSAIRYCDGFNDCRDGSDEVGCPTSPPPPPTPCRSDEFTCRTDNHCVPAIRHCDGFNDCRDGSDEEGCPTYPPLIPCRSDEFTCRSHHHCVPAIRHCDGFNDCRDGSDEEGCLHTPCQTDQFKCVGTDMCIPQSYRCNRRSDCPDNSDELDCPLELELKAYPSEQVAKESEEVVFLCRDESQVRAAVTWERGNGLPLPPGSRINITEGRLEMPDIQLSHGGPYICKAIGVAANLRGSEIFVNLRVVEWPRQSPKPSCSINEATCRNGACIPREYVCNGRPDCSDGSDEQCPPRRDLCEPNEFRCRNERCIQKSWRCDAEDDCGDGSDEENCPRAPAGSDCRDGEFKCFSTKQCIPKAFQCDVQIDCSDGSDEIGCSEVRITKHPPRDVSLYVGQTFNISCEAFGTPTPEVVWRFNWGHVPDKCVTSSENGVGVLTCPNIEEADAGAYSCEGLNNRNRIFATDTILIVTRNIGPGPFVLCPAGQFNELANNPNECIACFCFGVTTECKSANLFTYQLPAPFYPFRVLNVYFNVRQVEVNIRSNELNPLQSSVQPISSNSFNIRGIVNESLHALSIYPYFALPTSYLGNQLKSYGGYIKYKIRFRGSGAPINSPSIIISGNGYTLLHIGTPLLPERIAEESVRFFVGSWYKLSRERTRAPSSLTYFPAELASRQEIMMTLAKLDHILLKIQFVESRQIDTTITDFIFDSAGTANTGQGKAAFVEQCTCPDGYWGLSCENCAPGYQRYSREPWLGPCVRPPPVIPCGPGTYKDPAGRCLPCPCPLTTPSNQFGSTCYLDTDGLPTCNCPTGYSGRQCEQCSPGFVGDPRTPGGSCQRTPCHPAGSTSLIVDPSTGYCNCKENTHGPYCDQCKAKTFYLSSSYVFGCISCFCMGVTEECFSSNWYRQQIAAIFIRDDQDFKIGSRTEVETSQSRKGFVNPNQREIIFTSFEPVTDGAYYWSLPQRFLGNKVTSYGGVLNYTIRYIPKPGGQFSKNNAPDVEIISENNGIRLYYYKRDSPVEPNTFQEISVPLLEQYWERTDGQFTNRQHLLMALSDLKAILIKATYTTGTDEVGLQNVILETAEDRNTGQRRAYEVEECRCPAGYRGTSCEECDAGYRRVEYGLYLGLCELCNCHGHTKDCDPETGICVNCANHTMGDYCDRCEPGYFGNPTSGEACVREGPCICDPRGSLNDDCRNGQCACKVNVVGQSCDSCRAGTFDLQQYHETGCLECYCSGVTNVCQSSNSYITQIPMPFLDSNHGFTLTESDRSRVIRVGFKLNIANNQVGYDYTVERGQRLFWSLPSQFTGNKILSYGGNLTWTQGYTAPSEAIPSYFSDVVIFGDGISIFWNNNVAIPPNQSTITSIKLEENGFRRVAETGTQRATRTDMLRVLSNIEAILIRASYASQTSFIYISDVSMDTAISQSLPTASKATQVEVCKCPFGYKGTSCESCITGYYQTVSSNGYNKECKKCPCNEREETCYLDGSSNVICKCKPGYSGNFCEVVSWWVNPNPPPSKIVVTISEPLIQIVGVGNTVHYNCKAESLENKPVSVKWSRENGALPDHAWDDGRGYFVLTKAEVSDSGTYLCTVYDGQSYVFKNVTIKVEDVFSPKVSISPETTTGTLEYREGDPILISCDATGTPTPDIEWIREDGAPAYKRVGIKSVAFRIPSARKTDEGTYTCQARNKGGFDYKQITVRVRDNSDSSVQPEPGVRVIIYPVEFTCTVGQNVRLDCSAIPEDYRLQWSRLNNEPLPGTAEERDGTLVIHNADAATSGVYICTAYSSTGQILAQSEVPVNVVGVDGGEKKSPIISIDPERQTVPQGNSAVMRCYSPSDPTAPIRWRKVNEEMTPNVQIIGSELRIPAVQVRDRGVYLCEIANEVGSSRASSTLEVERREPPAVQIYPHETQIIAEGGNTFIQCHVVRGIPTPRIKWLRRGQALSSPRVEEINSALRFTDVTEEDAGEYVCLAENVAGSTDATAVLKIISIPVVTIMPTGPLTFTVGQPVKVICSATGKPPPIITWSPSSSYGIPTLKTSAESNTAIMEINRVQLSDAGTYTCSATNDAGRSEEQIEIIVNGPEYEQPPVVNPIPTDTPEEEIVFPLGSQATLRCAVDGSSESIFIYWSRENNVPLPPNHDETRPGYLIINNVGKSDGGKYICKGVAESSGKELFRKALYLRIVVPPQITLVPPRQVVRPGDNAYVTCSATGDQPITIYWSAINGRPLPRSVTIDRGYLQFRGITVFDAGRYVCRARNFAGEAEAVAEVIVNEVTRPSPVITAEDHYRAALENSDLILMCTVSSSTSDYQITWTRDRSPLPATSQIIGNTLRLFRLRPEDSDRYNCRLTSPYGQSIDYIDLVVEQSCLTNEFRCNDGMCIPTSQFCDTVQQCADNSDELDCHKHPRGIHNVTLDIEASLEQPKVGDTIHLVCKVNGDQQSRVTWSKVDGTFEINAQMSGNILRISDLQIANTGTYRCSVATKDGDRSIDYRLNLQLVPGNNVATTAEVTKKSVKYGQSINLNCNTNSEEPVEYSWMIHSYEKSLRKIVPNSKELVISDVTANNSGLYFCNAVSNLVTVILPTVLIVEDVIPAFSGSSYMTFSPMVYASIKSDIEITFKPKDYDGLILFNGQKRDAKGDYISFGLVNGVPEFRFDVGSGPAMIRGDSPLKLNKWHTVRLARNTRNGFMEVNGLTNYTGSSPGKFETLDLQLPLYIGGHSNYTYISSISDYKTGFRGCINRLRIDSKNVDLRKEALDVENLESCNNCDVNPCLNNGYCQEALSQNGYTCICLPGFSGENCGLRKDTCYLDSCGNGQCLENDDGIECLCPFGKFGKRCGKNVNVQIPAFNKNSYLGYPSPLLKKKLKFSLKVKPVGEPYVEDGIILYIAESDSGKDDFISLFIVNSYVELKSRIYNKPVNLKSNHFLIPGEYVTISVTIDSSEVQFGVGDDAAIAEVFDPNNEGNDLRLHTNLYIGGYDKRSIILPEVMYIRTGFHGCISTVELPSTDISFLHSFIEAVNINDCVGLFGDVCETTNPCQNGGKCLTTRNTYRCECHPHFSGYNCERRKDMCEILQPCKNNGKCQGTTASYKCYCGLGYTGLQCEIETTLENTANFRGDGYIELSSSLLPVEALDKYLDLTFNTAQLNGLLFWCGQNESIYNGNDFIAVAIQNGYVQFNYHAGSAGTKSIKASDHRVNDNHVHSVIVRVTGSQISVELDSKTTEFGELPHRLNTRGNIFVGGVPGIRYMTGNQYQDNFEGCIQQLKIDSSVAVDFGRTAISAQNVAPCSYDTENQI